MASFILAIEKTLRLEGGYVYDPSDYGGETKYGISKGTYPELNIKDITLEQAKILYKKDFWDKLSLDKINDQSVAEELFDTAVNMGWKTATMFLQESLNFFINPLLKVDGLIGDKTIMATNKCKPQKLLKVLNGLQFERYKLIVKNDISQKKFFNGWLERI